MQETICASNLHPLPGKGESSFTDLPPEIILAVGDELDRADLLSLRKSSRRLHSLLEKPLLRCVAMQRRKYAYGLELTMRTPGQAQTALKMLHAGLPRCFLREMAVANSPDSLARIEWAAAEGHTELLEKMLEAGADPDACNGAYFPRHRVPHQWHRDRTSSYMMINKVDYGRQAKHKARPLHWAAARGRMDVVRLLVRYGATLTALNRDKKTAIHVAAEQGYRDIVYFLRDQSTAGKGTALHDACALGLYDEARELLAADGDEGGDVFSLDEGDNTPLHLAATPGWSEDLLRLLLDAGSDVTARNVAGRTPLHCVDGREPAVVKLLLDRGANVHLRDERGATPLLRVCGPGTAPESVRMLLDEGADVEVVSTDSECALMYLDNNEIYWTIRRAGLYCDLYRHGLD